MKTLRYKNVRGTLLIVYGTQPPDDGDWAHMIELGKALGTDLRRCLVFTDISIRADQRSEIASLIKSAGIRAVVVVTGSPISRMIVTGIGWITGVHKAFAPSNLDDALAALQVPDNDMRELVVTAHRFAEELRNTKLAAELVGHHFMSTAKGTAG